jgi:hypothetical protein
MIIKVPLKDPIFSPKRKSFIRKISFVCLKILNKEREYEKPTEMHHLTHQTIQIILPRPIKFHFTKPQT